MVNPQSECSVLENKWENDEYEALFFNTSQKKFTLHLLEKHVSTLKCLTPKRLTEKNKKANEKSDISGNSDV